MQAKVIVAGAVGAVIGAGVWALIAVLTGYQVGYVAWGIGALIGFCGKAVGGRGAQVGIICAAWALVAILGGKVIAVRIAMPREMGKIVGNVLTRESYTESMKDADDFVALKSEEEYAEFMISHKFSEATKAEEVKPEEIEKFKQENAEHLRKLNAERPTYEQWKAPLVEAAVEGARSGISTMDILKESFGIMSTVFLLLGVATAYRVGAGSDEE